MFLAIILLTAAVLFAALSMYLAYYGVHGRRHPLEDTKQDQIKQMPWVKDLLESCRPLEYEIRSYDGYILHAQMYSCGDTGKEQKESKKYIILIHGYTLNRYGELKYMPLYRELGYNCIVYDHRGHGLNEKAVCTYGIREGKDLMAVIDDTYRRFGEDIWLGLTGESLGSATEITALKYKPRVHFLVNDCGFAEIVPIMQRGLARLHMPVWLIYPASFACRLMYGYSMTKARPIDSLKDNTVPICFIHGEKDSFITPDHSVRMSKATKGYQELHIIKDAEHAKAINTDPELYKKIVTDFVRGVEEGRIT